MEPNEKKRAIRTVAAFAAAMAYIAFFSTTGVGFLRCPINAITSFSCFGCGMTRSFRELVHGDLAAAFEFHLLGPLFFAGFASVAAVNLVELVRGRRIEWAPIRFVRQKQVWIWAAFGIALFAFGIVRFAQEILAMSK